MAVRRRGVAILPHAPAAVLQVLCNGAQLADWNPAFSSSAGAGTSHEGTQVQIVVKGLRGTVTYLQVEPEKVVLDIRVPGLTERCSWWLEPVPGGTRVTHELLQTGILATLLEPGTAGVADLRLNRLGRRLTTPGQTVA